MVMNDVKLNVAYSHELHQFIWAPIFYKTCIYFHIYNKCGDCAHCEGVNSSSINPCRRFKVCLNSTVRFFHYFSKGLPKNLAIKIDSKRKKAYKSNFIKRLQYCILYDRMLFQFKRTVARSTRARRTRQVSTPRVRRAFDPSNKRSLRP